MQFTLKVEKCLKFVWFSSISFASFLIDGQKVKRHVPKKEMMPIEIVSKENEVSADKTTKKRLPRGVPTVWMFLLNGKLIYCWYMMPGAGAIKTSYLCSYSNTTQSVKSIATN